MGLFDRAIKRGLNRALGNAVENAVQQAVAPTINNAVNQTADRINSSYRQQTQQGYPQQTMQQLGTPPQGYGQPQTYAQQQNVQQAGATLGGALGSLTGMMQGFANEAAKSMKICPSCGEGASASQKFCPKCGSALPEQTVAQGAVCTSCGAQNAIGTKFCVNCGQKLPSAIAEENAARQRDEQELAQWDTLLPQYPKWCFGGYNFNLERNGENNGYPCYYFNADGVGQNELRQYRDYLRQNGFTPAGQYPSEDMLYRMIGNVCYYFESCEPFGGDGMSVSFGVGEPNGGFYYKEPEKKAPTSLRDLFKF